LTYFFYCGISTFSYVGLIYSLNHFYGLFSPPPQRLPALVFQQMITSTNDYVYGFSPPSTSAYRPTSAAQAARSAARAL
jgi:hypothetical protein